MVRGSRLTAVLTGKAREISAEKAHERNTLAIARRITRAEDRLRELAREQKRLRAQLRADRREYRAVLQRTSSITVDDEQKLAAGGHADAIDALNARHER